MPATHGLIRHATKPVHGRYVLRGVATLGVFLLSFAATGVGLGYARLQGNIDQHDIGELLGDDRPTREEPTSHDPEDPHAGEELNFVILGSDSREGENATIDGSGSSEGMRADTTLLVHISADRSHVDVVSIPRDTLVDIPSCRLPDGTWTEPQENVMFNSAFNIGGETGDVGAAAACTIRTVEEMTDIYIDDFAVVDFTGFINVVDALGGIAMYIPEDIDDRAADLQLEAGCRLLDGPTALGYARVRHIGDGSDIQRIDRQQDIVMEIIEEALSTGLLTDPLRLYQVLDTATQTLTTSRGLGSLPNLAGLGGSLAGLDSENITFVTMPFDWSGARVVESAEYAPYVWEAIANDTPLDPAISGVGWELVQAGIPPWSSETESASEGSSETASSSATPIAGNVGTASPSAGTSPDPSEEPSTEPETGTESETDTEPEAGTTGPVVGPPSDPAQTCTKENAT